MEVSRAPLGSLLVMRPGLYISPTVEVDLIGKRRNTSPTDQDRRSSKAIHDGGPGRTNPERHNSSRASLSTGPGHYSSVTF